jgi:hypothetical protein
MVTLLPPRKIGKAGLALWKKFVESAQFDDPGELHALFNASQLEDDIARCREQLAEEKLIVVGSTGQPVENPLLGSIRNATQLQARLLDSIAHEESDASSAGRRLRAARSR